MTCPRFALGPLLAALWLLVAPLVASARPPAPESVPPQAIARAIELAGAAARAVAPADARVVVEPGALDGRLQLAPCSRVDAYLPAGVPAWGRTRVGLRCSDGAARWNVQLPLTVQVWARAAVLTTPLPAGARVDASQVALAEVDWSAGPTPPLAEPESLAGRVLVRALAAGSAPRATDLQPRQWFALGATVTLVASGQGFAISSEAQALTPGLEGQPARVRTETGRILTGRAIGNHRVEVSL